MLYQSQMNTDERPTICGTCAKLEYTNIETNIHLCTNDWCNSVRHLARPATTDDNTLLGIFSGNVLPTDRSCGVMNVTHL